MVAWAFASLRLGESAVPEAIAAAAGRPDFLAACAPDPRRGEQCTGVTGGRGGTAVMRMPAYLFPVVELVRPTGWSPLPVKLRHVPPSEVGPPQLPLILADLVP